MALYEYIQDFSRAISGHKASRLKSLLTINPGPTEGALRAGFNDPNDVDLYLVAEKFKPVVRAYIQLMRSIYVASDIDRSFHDHIELMIHVNRAAETKSNWVCPALINCSNELMSVYQVRSKQYPDVQEGLEKSENALEQVASTINRSFKICLTDKTGDASMLKKLSIHFFLASLIKIYFKLNRLELARSMEKALVGTGLAIPTIVHSPVEYRKYIVTYLYYSALLSLDDGDFAFAETKLLTAMEFLACYRLQKKVASQTEKILFLLVPLKMHLSRATLPAEVWERFPALKYVYKDSLFNAIYEGNLAQFDACVLKFQKIFLKRHLYVLVIHLRNLCYLRLVRRTVAIYGEMQTTSLHIVPFSCLEVALKYSDHANTDDLECILANLIEKRYIKGYLLHSNRCIVLLKAEAFPKC